MSGPFDLTEKAIAEHPLPSNFVHSSQAVATWIDATAPCVKSVQSQAVTDKIVAHPRQMGAHRAKSVPKPTSLSRMRFSKGPKVKPNGKPIEAAAGRHAALGAVRLSLRSSGLRTVLNERPTRRERMRSCG